MHTITCVDIRRWLATPVKLPPDPEVVEHLLTCAVCQGGLVLASIAGQEGGEALDCATCQRHLPELLEALDGIWNMGDAHIQTLIHICTCADCREMYRMVSMLRAAEQVGVLRPPPRADMARAGRRQVSLLKLSREFLHVMLPARGAHAAMTRGAEDGEIVLAATETSAGFSLQVSAQPGREGTWALTITLRPAPVGWVELHLGAALFRAPLHSDGTARLFDIPAELLSAQEGPGLEIGLALAPEA